jgi:hypothetical protein
MQSTFITAFLLFFELPYFWLSRGAGEQPADVVIMGRIAK